MIDLSYDVAVAATTVGRVEKSSAFSTLSIDSVRANTYGRFVF